MLIDEACVPLVLSELRPDDFVDGTCRAAFAAIRKLTREGGPVDPVTVLHAMQGGDRLVNWMQETMDRTHTAANVEPYIGIVKEEAALHRFRELCKLGVFARQLFCLEIWYNTALIGVEANFSTYPVMELERLGYPKQYVRESVDDYTHKVRHSYGFVTSSKTRPVIISELVKVVREDVEAICDEETLLEMLSFVRNERTLRPEAEAGGHDDLVLSLAIAHHIRGQQSYVPEAPANQARRWTEDMWEDYRNASPADQAMLIERWGRPRG